MKYETKKWSGKSLYVAEDGFQTFDEAEIKAYTASREDATQLPSSPPYMTVEGQDGKEHTIHTGNATTTADEPKSGKGK